VSNDFDARVRAAAFAYLRTRIDHGGERIRRHELEAFEFEGMRRLIAPRQGIWAPQALGAALSIMTTYSGSPAQRPYADEEGPDGYLRYKWRGTDPQQADNRQLRKAMELRQPLVWLHGVAPGLFTAAFPVWLVGEETSETQFVVALDELSRDQWRESLVDLPAFNPVRRYAEVMVRQRLHQPVFRGQVLVAYESQCALCRLRHERLLDAAHIKEDSDGGEPVVTNGLAMCAIHHRAFDADVLGLRPDCVVEINDEVLNEHDGPTLQHALQGLHGQAIALPKRRRDHPNQVLLEERYERFRAAG
jgi:putative restriction endonuclease